MSLFALQTIWFVLVAVLLAGYVILDGFDLGAGIWYWRLGRDDRRTVLASIGPVWDGNEVWLLTGGGAMFAAFPHVYATVFSGFYLALLLVVLALVFRGVSIEFRNKVDSARWRRFWDIGFAAGSSLTALLLGVALGNVLRGLPLDAERNYTGGFLALLNPYSLLVGVLGFVALATQGALYLAAKTTGDLRARAIKWARGSSVVWAALALATGALTLGLHEHLQKNYLALPVLWILPVAALGVLGVLIVQCRRGKALAALLWSSVALLVSWVLVGVGLFPNLVPAANDAALSLTVENASSTLRTLTLMLVLALAGMPIVIGYQIWLYRTFRHPVGGGAPGVEY